MLIAFQKHKICSDLISHSGMVWALEQSTVAEHPLYQWRQRLTNIGGTVEGPEAPSEARSSGVPREVMHNPKYIEQCTNISDLFHCLIANASCCLNFFVEPEPLPCSSIALRLRPVNNTDIITAPVAMRKVAATESWLHVKIKLFTQIHLARDPSSRLATIH